MNTIVKIIISSLVVFLAVGVISLVLLGLFFDSLAKEVDESKVTEEVDVGVGEGDDSGVDDKDEDEEEGEEHRVEEDYDKVLLDDKGVKVKLTSIEKVTDDFWEEEYYQVNLEITNNSNETIEVQANETSIDGKMVDDMVVFSETVSSGKFSETKMIIEGFEEELPELNNELEFKLVVWGHDNMDLDIEDNVTIEAK